MGIRVRDLLMGEPGELRYEPIDKRIRATVAGRPVVDTQRALLVWEPKRVVPSYGVPVQDVDAELVATPAAPSADPPAAPELAGRPVYDPSIPFSVHTTERDELDLRVGGTERPGAAFRARDDALGGYVILDFGAFDAWYEEDELNVAHLGDPFHRIDIVHSSREVRVERDGEVVAQSTSPYLLFEPPLPIRYYLAPEDVSPGLLRPGDTKTVCAYKGQAS
jgi:uncharacterized protein (DUF427 family)